MSSDTSYKSFPLILKSRGIVARPIIDRAPEHTYLNLDNAEEREEDALSSRYGSIIVNRDPDGTPSGVNYPLPGIIRTLARLKTPKVNYRYSNSGNVLYRRAGDTQGAYSKIFTGLSGNPFSAVVASCFQSSLPFLFIADQLAMLKDSGTGLPQQWGIFPPAQIVNALQYSPAIVPIDNFTSSSGYSTGGGFSVSSHTIFAAVNGSSRKAILDYFQYTCPDTTVKKALSGMLCVDQASGDLNQLFNVLQNTSTFDINPLGNPTAASNVFNFGAVNGAIGSNVTGTIGKTASFDFSNYMDDDLFILVLKASSPAAIQEIRLQFDVDGSGYTTSYYYKSVIPASYQGGISLPQTIDPTQAVNAEVFARASGASNLSQVGFPFENILPTDDPSLQHLQPAQITTGDGSWSVLFLRKGDFLPVGNAGKPGLDWSNITGWQIQITTNTQGSSGLSFNALYLQGGFGPSSYGGVGYDYRYTFYNANTGTESNPCRSQYFPITPTNPAGLPTLIPLRQALNVTGNFSLDPQVTHVRIYRRGGVLADNWRRVDQIPNVNAGAVATITAVEIIVVGAQNYVRLTFSGFNPFPLGSIVTPVGMTTVPALNGIPGRTISPGFPAPGSNQVVYKTALTTPVLFTVETGLVTAATQWSYKDVFSDASLFQASILQLDNDVPVTSTLQIPIVTSLSAPISPMTPFGPVTVSVSDATKVFVANQIVTVGNVDNLEQVIVIIGGIGFFIGCMQLTHASGEPVLAFSTPAQPLNLAALAYGNIWLAGDPNNPHYLYFSKASFPESFSPANYIVVSSTSDPIMAVINFRGTLFVATLTTWYQIFPGNPPYAQPTGSKHGLVAQFGWTQTESSIWYQAIDGIREFRGVDGAYRSLMIEWLFQNVNQTLTPIPLADLTRLSTFRMAFQNNQVYAVYYDSNGVGHRVSWSTNYSRWRNDDVNATAIYFEEDTNTLLYARALASGGYVICQDRVGDYDDGGWVAGALTKLPIVLDIQTPYLDQGAPNNQKQYNVLTIDANTNGQTLTVTLLFDDGATPLVVGTIQSVTRTKFQLKLNGGLGQQAYRVSLQITGPTIVAPIIYQADIHTATLAEQRASFDSYWIKFGADESKLVKQGYFDYTSTAPVSVSLYADGNAVPYYSFTLPANPTRFQVAERVRFPAKIVRQWRIVMTVPAGQTMQVWQNPQIDTKPIMVGKGYARSELVTT